MPAITLSADEVGPGVLPPVCMVCGGPAGESRSVGFSWVPAWTYFLLLAQLWPFVAAYVIFRRQMTVDAPTCRRHRPYWLMRKLVLPIGLFVAWAVLVYPWLTPSTARDYPFWAWVSAATIFLVTVSAALWLRFTGVRAVAITRDEIKLAGVAPAFVAAVAAGRAEYAQQQQEWIGRYDRKAADED